VKKVILFILFIVTLALSFLSCVAFIGLYNYFFLNNNEGAIAASHIMIGSIPHMIVYALIIAFNRDFLVHKILKFSIIPFVLILVSDAIIIVSQLIYMYT